MITPERAHWFAESVCAYTKQYGRLDLPWKTPATPYRVWVSEVMLQQTQVQTVMDYFQRFMERLPDIRSLSLASIDEVLSLWAGLGYYRRAHFLHQTSQRIMSEFKGEFPQTLAELMSLPGIGPSTAGAILAQAFKIRAPILDGNVKRVLSRFFAIPGWPESPDNLKKLWRLSDLITPHQDVDLYTQGIMDLGAVICTKKAPSCEQCPIMTHCEAHKTQTQTLYPASKPQKAKPTRQCLFTLFLNEKDECLLIKRPPEGIWGGLWCLPSMPYVTDIKKQCQKQWQDVASVLKVGKKDKHSFTHFHLEYKTVIMQTNKLFRFKAREQVWIHPNDFQAYGVPAPIKKILNHFALVSV